MLSLVLCVILDSDCLDDVTKKYKVKGYLSLEEMLADSDVDVVTICTPSGCIRNKQ